MKKKFNYYYGFLSLVVFAQVLLTVFNLSQNIAYGQKINYLENKKHLLVQEKIQIKKNLSNQLAIRVLKDEETVFQNITDVTVVKTSKDSLALK